MQTHCANFAPGYRKISSTPCEPILPRDSLAQSPASTVSASLCAAGRADDEHGNGVGDEASPSWRQSARRVGLSREFMERHLDQPVRIAMLAARAGVSISHFFKLFKEDTGCAPVVYMTRLKMERARAWLVTTDWSIKLIAADLGYHDPLYFSRVFKSIIGMAPKTYRRSIKKERGRRGGAV